MRLSSYVWLQNLWVICVVVKWLLGAALCHCKKNKEWLFNTAKNRGSKERKKNRKELAWMFKGDLPVYDTKPIRCTDVSPNVCLHGVCVT